MGAPSVQKGSRHAGGPPFSFTMVKLYVEPRPYRLRMPTNVLLRTAGVAGGRASDSLTCKRHIHRAAVAGVWTGANSVYNSV